MAGSAAAAEHGATLVGADFLVHVGVDEDAATGSRRRKRLDRRDGDRVLRLVRDHLLSALDHRPAADRRTAKLDAGVMVSVRTYTSAQLN